MFGIFRSPWWSNLPLSDGEFSTPFSGAPSNHNVVDPPPSRLSASCPPNIRIRWVNSAMLTPVAFPLRRPSTVMNTVFLSFVVNMALRGCLVLLNESFSSFHTLSPFNINSGPDANVDPFFCLYPVSISLLQGRILVLFLCT